MDNFEFSFELAHPKAKMLMKEDFLWSPIEESAPFGSDDGWDAAYGFRQWRLENKTASPVSFLQEIIESWQYPYFDYSEMDTNKIKDYMNAKKELSEEEIQAQIQTFKEISKNSPDTSFKVDDDQLRQLVLSSTNSMGGLYLLGLDNAIIGIGFAQFALEGRIDSDIKKLTIIAINRQLYPFIINRYDGKYRDKRRLQLTKMLEIITKADS